MTPPTYFGIDWKKFSRRSGAALLVFLGTQCSGVYYGNAMRGQTRFLSLSICFGNLGKLELFRLGIFLFDGKVSFRQHAAVISCGQRRATCLVRVELF